MWFPSEDHLQEKDPITHNHRSFASLKEDMFSEILDQEKFPTIEKIIKDYEIGSFQWQTNWKTLDCNTKVDNKIISTIDQGIVLFIGIENADTNVDIEWICKKVSQLRIFDDENKIMNKSLLEIGGDLLVISQFTLHALTKKGNRPSYIKAAKSNFAIKIYNQFLNHIEIILNKKPFAGIFGADMLVKIENDGPVTIFLDSKNKSF